MDPSGIDDRLDYAMAPVTHSQRIKQLEQERDGWKAATERNGISGLILGFCVGFVVGAIIISIVTQLFAVDRSYKLSIINLYCINFF